MRSSVTNYDVRVALLAIVIAGCKSHPCDRFIDLAESCLTNMPGDTISDMRFMCVSDQNNKRANDPPSAFDACMPSKTCDELNACFKKRDCKFILTSPDDRVPQFSCW